jgi:deazaflavin-dependent oxidoreductase (nitroreductase family)
MSDPTESPAPTPSPTPDPAPTPGPTTAHYKAPGFFTKQIANRLMSFLTRLGLSVRGSRVLEVRGRTSGEPRRTPVNLLAFDGKSYLVSPRGEGQWVRNVRAADGRLATIVGKRREEWRARELAGDEKIPVLREYLRRWKAETGVFFGGASADWSDAQLAEIAPRHPAFELAAVAGEPGSG